MTRGVTRAVRAIVSCIARHSASLISKTHAETGGPEEEKVTGRRSLMGYRTLRQCVDDLAATGSWSASTTPSIPISKRPKSSGACFRRADRPCTSPASKAAASHGLQSVRDHGTHTLHLPRLAGRAPTPGEAESRSGRSARRPRLYLHAPWAAWFARPRQVRSGPVLAKEITLSQLPQLRCWPEEGGNYITLPEVYTEDPDQPGLAHSNLGMYRVQISGGQYEPEQQAGLHYQIHRGIAVHHAAAIRRKERLRVNVFVGGPPAMTVAAILRCLRE